MKFEAGPEFASLIRAGARAANVGKKTHGRAAAFRLRVEGGRVHLDAWDITRSEVAFTGSAPITTTLNPEPGSVIVPATDLVDALPSSAKDRKTARYEVDGSRQGWLLLELGTSTCSLSTLAEDDLPSLPLPVEPSRDFGEWPVGDLLKTLDALEPAVDNVWSHCKTANDRLVRLREDGDWLATGGAIAVRVRGPGSLETLAEGRERLVMGFDDIVRALKAFKEWPGPKTSVRIMADAGQVFLFSANVAAVLRRQEWQHLPALEEVLDRRPEGPRVLGIPDVEAWASAVKNAVRWAGGVHRSVRLEPDPKSDNTLLSVPNPTGPGAPTSVLPSLGTITADPVETSEEEGTEARDGSTPPYLEFNGPLFLALLEDTFGSGDAVLHYSLGGVPCRLVGREGREAWIMPIVPAKEES